MLNIINFVLFLIIYYTLNIKLKYNIILIDIKLLIVKITKTVNSITSADTIYYKKKFYEKSFITQKTYKNASMLK